jgi:predicted transcriptional regulator
MSLITQRDKMRELARIHPKDEGAIIKAYAQAERSGIVTRQSNGRNISPEDYASRLYADGVKKGWLRG